MLTDVTVLLCVQKAMLDLGSEWDQNKRILSLGRPGTGAYKAIPPNFGYFCVEFGIDGGGYAKVIEDWSAFPLHFGRVRTYNVLTMHSKPVVRYDRLISIINV